MAIDKDGAKRERISIFEENDIAPSEELNESVSPNTIHDTRKGRGTTAKELKKVGEAAGFHSREPAESRVDGRSARATNRTKQTNMKVTPEVNKLLIQRVHEKGFPSIGAYVEFLLYKDMDMDP